MSKIEIRDLIKRLNSCCRTCLEEAGSLCVASGHREVTIEHFMLSLLKQDSCDIRILLQSNGQDPNSLSDIIEQVFRRFKVVEAGRTPSFSPLLVELLEDAWLLTSTKLDATEIRSGTVLAALVRDLGRYVSFDYYEKLSGISSEHVINSFDDATAGSVEAPDSQVQNQNGNSQGSSTAGSSEGSALAKFGFNFTEAARNGEVDPIFCRDDEIRQIVEILCRRRKNNPICVGEAGVGKTALAEGLALKIVEGNVPDALKEFELWGLDIGSLQAGASVKGEFERRLKNVIEEVKNSSTPLILFIDEAHTLIGAGNSQGGSDAANLLKPALARGELKTIAATTWSEYKKFFEKDPALTRRFQLVQLDEPSVEDTIVILRGLKGAYEKSHNVYINEEALEAAARLSSRYITGRQLPDKAIDIIDTACARVRANSTTTPPLLNSLNEESLSLQREKKGLKRDLQTAGSNAEKSERVEKIDYRLAELETQKVELEGAFEEQSKLAGSFVEQRQTLLSEDETEAETNPNADLSKLTQLRKQLDEVTKDNPLVSVEVGSQEIADIISDWTGIPVSSMAEDDYERLLNLGEIIKKTIKGQDHAVDLIEARLRASRLDLHKQGQPLGIFLLFGPSGVGKTETALEVARNLFGGEQFLTTINMSEYQERHTISRLIGSPPGYVGFGEGGVLTEAIRKMPYSVVLLDEVEKADTNVLNLFYQAFDKGELNDGEGRLIDCKNVVFFLTSNLGSDQIEQWVHSAEDGKVPSTDNILKSIQPLLSDHFKPALLARMEPIVYLPLQDDVLSLIVDARITKLIENLKLSQKIDLSFSEASINWLKSMCDVAANGARLVDQVIQRRILPPLSLEILEAGQKGEKVTSILVDSPDQGGLSFEMRLLEVVPDNKNLDEEVPVSNAA